MLVRSEGLLDTGFLVGQPDTLGHFHIEQENGRRILDANVDPVQQMRVALPADEWLWLRTETEEARFRVGALEYLEIETLAFRPLQASSRGSVAASLQAGLFASSYGVAYYSGWTDSQGLLPVELAARSGVSAPTEVQTERGAEETNWTLVTTLGLFGAAGAFGVVAAAAAVGMSISWVQFHSTDLQAPASDAADRFHLLQIALIGLGSVSVGLAVAGVAAATWWGLKE